MTDAREYAVVRRWAARWIRPLAHPIVVTLAVWAMLASEPVAHADGDRVVVTLTREQIIEALSGGEVELEFTVEVAAAPSPDEPAPEDDTPPTPDTPPEVVPEEPVETEPTEPPIADEPDDPATETAPAELSDVATYRGITVRFDRPVNVYESVSGCPVVESPDGEMIKIVSYSPAPNGVLHGAHWRPRYDHGGQAVHATAPLYRAEHRARLPIELAPGDKVLIADTYTEAEAKAGTDGIHWVTWPQPSARPILDEVFPLVVVSEPPPEGFFRPGLAHDGDTTIRTVADVRWDLVEGTRLAVSEDSPPDVSRLLARIAKPWAAYTGAEEASGLYTTWQGQFIATKGGEYGRDRAALYGEAIVAALSDIPREQKFALTILCLQQSIDILSIARSGSIDNPVRWGHARGGLGAGYGLPLLTLGVLMDDDEVLALVRGNRDLVQEFSQTAVLDDALAPRGYLEPWPKWTKGGTTPNGYLMLYPFPVARGDVVWADTTMPSVNSSNSPGWSNYVRCCTANSWHGWTLFADGIAHANPELGSVRKMAGHDELFHYMDVYMKEAKERNFPNWQQSWSPFLRAMFDLHRTEIGPPVFVQPSRR